MYPMTKLEREQALERLDRGFMRPAIWRGDCWEVSANGGETHYVPGDVVSYIDGATVADLQDYIEGQIDVDDDGTMIATFHRNVWLARLLAPGYMDQTDLTMHATRTAAEDYLIETYDDGSAD